MIVGPGVGHRTLHPIRIRIRIREHLTSINLLRVSPIKAGDSLTRVGDNLTKKEIKVGDLKASLIRAGDLKASLIRAGGLRVNPTRVGGRQDLRVNLIKANLTRVGDTKLLLVGASKDTSRDMAQLPEMMIT